MTIRVLKPSDERATWRVPNPVAVLVHAVITLKYNSGGTQIVNRPANVRDYPSQRCVWSGVDALDLLNPQHRIADSKDQRWRLVRHKCQTKHSLIKRSRLFRVRSCQKQNWIIETHNCGPHSLADRHRNVRSPGENGSPWGRS